AVGVVEQHLLLVAEVAEEGGATDVGPVGDLGDGDRVEAALGEQLVGGRHDRRPDPALLADLPWLRAARRLVHAVSVPSRIRGPSDTEYHMVLSTNPPKGEARTIPSGRRSRRAG